MQSVCPTTFISPVAKHARKIAAAVVCTLLSVTGQSFAQEPAPSALSETYQDWVVQCATAQVTEKDGKKQSGGRICQISQELLQASSRERVLTIAFDAAQGEGKGLSGTIIVPFGLDLQSGITLRLEKKALLKAAFKTCLPQGCLVPIAADGALEKELRAGAKLIVEVATADTGQRLELGVSLKGFSQSLDRLMKLAAATE